MNSEQVPLGLSPVQAPNFQHVIGQDAVIHGLRQEPFPDFVYLWGEASSGKSLVLNALFERLRRSTDQVMLISARTMQDVPILNVLPPGLKYLLLDDVNLLAGQADAELSLFNVYNHCRSQQTHLILASCLAPRDDQWQLPDLRSRLASALQLPLTVLKGDQAWQAFDAMFTRHGMRLDPAVLRYIQSRYSDQLDKLAPLFGALAEASLRLKKPVTIPMVKATITPA